MLAAISVWRSRGLHPTRANRPATALDVARSLPGGDPLTEALAAGERPSPDMVAASENTGVLSVLGAVACLAAILVGLAILIASSIGSASCA